MNILMDDIRYLDIETGELKTASIGIEDGIIRYIGDIPEGFKHDRYIDGKDKTVIPGIFNAHTHIPMTILRNYSDDKMLWDWLNKDIWPAESRLNEDDIYWGAMLGLSELIRFGTTCFVDMYFYIDRIGEALEKSGLRGFISRGLIGNADPDMKQLKETEDFIKKWDGRGNGRIRGMVGPHAPYTCPPEYLKRAAELAGKYGKSIHIHLSESNDEVRESMEKYGMTPVKHLQSLGIFEHNTLAAHCVKLTDEDIDILAESRVSVLYNPVSNMKLGNGFARIKDLKAAGINIAIGTDGCASNNDMSVLEEMKIASVVNKGVERDPTFLPALDIVRMATANGIRAVGLQKELGSIEIGKKADLTVIDTEKIQTVPDNNFISALAYSVQADSVYAVIVDGKILFENGEFKTLDIEEIIYNVKRISQKI